MFSRQPPFEVFRHVDYRAIPEQLLDFTVSQRKRRPKAKTKWLSAASPALPFSSFNKKPCALRGRANKSSSRAANQQANTDEQQHTGPDDSIKNTFSVENARIAADVERDTWLILSGAGITTFSALTGMIVGGFVKPTVAYVPNAEEAR